MISKRKKIKFYLYKKYPRFYIGIVGIKYVSLDKSINIVENAKIKLGLYKCLKDQ